MVLLIGELTTLIIATIKVIELIIIGIISATIFALWIGSGGFLFILSIFSPAVNLATLGVTAAASVLVNTAGSSTGGISNVAGGLSSVGSSTVTNPVNTNNASNASNASNTSNTSNVSNASNTSNTSNVSNTSNALNTNNNTYDTDQMNENDEQQQQRRLSNESECTGDDCYNKNISRQIGKVTDCKDGIISVTYADGSVECISDSKRASELFYNNFKYSSEIFPEIPFGTLLITLIKTKTLIDQNPSFRNNIVSFVLKTLIRIIQLTMYNVNMAFLNIILPLLPRSDLDELDEKFPWLDVYHSVLLTRYSFPLLNNLLNARARFNKNYSKIIYENLINKGENGLSLLRFIDKYTGIIQYYKNNEYDFYIDRVNKTHEKFKITEFNHPIEEYKTPRFYIDSPVRCECDQS
ncbi:hypothetical protein [Dasineura jujubifolia toursvirus 2a]|nr:hypothetical protein [Dasineura jujubifolia toursvirus 2a]